MRTRQRIVAGLAALLVAAAAAAPPPPPAAEKTWPSSQDGLVFLWQGARGANRVVDQAGRTLRVCRLVRRGRALWGPQWQMLLAGGHVEPEKIAEPLLTACRQSGQLGLELVFLPQSLDAGAPGRIVTFSDKDGRTNVALSQVGKKLVLHLLTSAGDNGQARRFVLGPLDDTKPHHLVVSFADNKVTCVLDGKGAGAHAVPGDLTNWKPRTLQLGDAVGGGADFTGQIRRLAIYSRSLNLAEAQANHQRLAEALKPAPAIERIEVTARLVDQTTIPRTRWRNVYRQALVVHSWKVEQVHVGKMEAKTIAVAHWLALDGQILPEARRLERGLSCRLVLEPLDQKNHPELVNVLTLDDTGRFDLERFVQAD
ncbi:MAG: LamG-like jellyroll fold domain-containing protein [Planctomycetota bacterium]